MTSQTKIRKPHDNYKTTTRHDKTRPYIQDNLQHNTPRLDTTCTKTKTETKGNDTGKINSRGSKAEIEARAFKRF